ncbi:hypothetical protein Q3V37_27905 [Micromonospora profundi]|uniref:Uncharacterized protein n=1 Tax=Micromonospora profundi TaxID=1420889 RepID=A0AAJ6HS19_9ACTN|nr:hypothetical protein [Micromonospora profundi]WLS45147.1 hypothetical protein Q3V37_27905 [Micromonospora profundi]
MSASPPHVTVSTFGSPPARRSALATSVTSVCFGRYGAEVFSKPEMLLAAVISPAVTARRVGGRHGYPNAGTDVAGSWAARVFRCYPVSLVVLAPYVLFILPVAVVYENPDLGTLVRLTGLALAGSFLVETVALPFRRSGLGWNRGARAANDHPRIYAVARGVAMVSILADLTGVMVGRGTVFTQVSGSLPDSPLGSLSALVSGWSALAVALLISAALGGRANTRGVAGWLLALALTQALLVVMTARASPLLGFISFLAAAGVISGIVRARYLAVAAVVLALAWPAIFELRNDIREGGGVSVSEQVTADDRLRLDLQMSAVAHHRVPVDLPKPGPEDYLRYGLVPRVLDTDRPTISTGTMINQYLGGSAISAYSFLTLGNVYFLDGPLAVVAYYGLWSALVVLLLRAGGPPGPVRLAALCFTLAGPLLWSGTYPDSMIAIIQHMVSAVPVFVLLGLTGRFGRSGGRQHAGRHRPAGITEFGYALPGRVAGVARP